MRRIRFRLTFDIELGDEDEEGPEIATHAISTAVLEPPGDDSWEDRGAGFRQPPRRSL